jgi:LIM and senescent cell antigen-like-containing domain protein 1/2
VGAVFYEHQGLPYCETHYNELTGDACGRCGRPSQGRSVQALNRHWCEGHFCCVGCDVDLAAPGEVAKYYERDCLPMCKGCYRTLPAAIQRRLAHYAEQERKVRADKEKAAAAAAAAAAKKRAAAA